MSDTRSKAVGAMWRIMQLGPASANEILDAITAHVLDAIEPIRMATSVLPIDEESDAFVDELPAGHVEGRKSALVDPSRSPTDTERQLADANVNLAKRLKGIDLACQLVHYDINRSFPQYGGSNYPADLHLGDVVEKYIANPLFKAAEAFEKERDEALCLLKEGDQLIRKLMDVGGGFQTQPDLDHSKSWFGRVRDIARRTDGDEG